jgi:hypothetical protein
LLSSVQPRRVPLTGATIFAPETIGFQSLSLRQSYRDQHSPLGFGALKSPITVALRAKPPHCGEPVGTPKFSLLARLSPNLPTAEI